ncbi:MAG: hypothetical protein ACI4V1_00450, partial [Eubacteriales bacterium]
MKKTISLLLALLMLGASVAACSDAGGGENENAGEKNTGTSPSSDPLNTDGETEAEETEASRASIPDDLPERDFEGRDFIVLGSDDEHFGDYVVVEELNGEVVNDSVYSRNLTIEERFNAKVARYALSSYGDTTTAIKTAVQAGDSETFHLVSYHVVEAGGVAMQEFFMNWYDIPHINFEKPWWSLSTVNDLSVNDHCFLAVGDAAVSSISQTYCVLYDKDAVKNYNLEDLYTTVRDGKWTMDYLIGICETVSLDLDGNGQMDENDYFGLASSPYSAVNTYLWACDNQIFVKQDDGSMVFSYYNEHLVDIFDKVYKLFKETGGVYAPAKSDHMIGIKQFQNYGSLFCNSLLSHTTNYLTEYEHEYGIIPYPKYDEAQARYKTMVDGNHEAMAVAKNAVDLDFIGVLTEVMCAEAYKQILPAYYDVCLKQRYASSPEDAEMIELCVDSRVFDLGYVY